MDRASDSIVFSVHTENSVFEKHRFQIAPLWRAFSNGSVFGDRFRRCSVDDSRIRSKTAPFSFENGLVRTGPNTPGSLIFPSRAGLEKIRHLPKYLLVR